MPVTHIQENLLPRVHVCIILCYQQSHKEPEEEITNVELKLDNVCHFCLKNVKKVRANGQQFCFVVGLPK